MRPPLIVGILKETKNELERRAPLTPDDVEWLVKRDISVEVEKNPRRIFPDAEYQKAGAMLVDDLDKASLLVGIKGARSNTCKEKSVYFIFSHTAKGQFENRPLLKECLRKKVTLMDFEKIEDADGRRQVYFGRYAGICGCVDSLSYLGKKLDKVGIKNPFSIIKPMIKYSNLTKLKTDLITVRDIILTEGFVPKLRPFVIGITGHGHVSQGVQEILNVLEPADIHPRDMKTFIRKSRRNAKRIHKIVFHREEKFRSKKGKGFYFEHYLEHPEQYSSRMDEYVPYINLLIHCSYWAPRYPRLVTRKMLRNTCLKKSRLFFIGDLSCDVGGSIEVTDRTTTSDDPVFTYDPKKNAYHDGYDTPGITILAVDNLPSELPRESSNFFSSMTREYIYQIALHGVMDITSHAALPIELRRAVITEGGRLTKRFSYLNKFLK